MTPSTAPDAKQDALATAGLTVSFGGTRALKEFTMSVRTGERVGLIGPNGAGKSTFINAVTGYTRSSGTIRFGGRQLRGMSPHRRAGLGLVRTFQNLSLFGTMTVAENISLGLGRAGKRIPAKPENNADFNEVVALLGLERVVRTSVRDLPYGTRKLVELARAMVSRPEVLLLDEPVAGLDTSEKARFVKSLRGALDALECSTVLVEHDMFTVEALTHRVYVLSSGAEIAEGPFSEVARDQEVITAYLGA
jgi:ABC-type branched-subunit amino acid transport system ATPase component